MFVQRVAHFCKSRRLFEEGERILLAVSGGLDSMALLETFGRLGVPCYVAHLDHMLRGEESADDARFVVQQAEKRGMPVEAGRIDVAKRREEAGVSIETAAREARLTFLRETAERVGADKIALAHHQDDLAETVLMRLLRGAGAGGLAGMSPRRGRWIRPFLETPRAEIERFARENDLSYRKDPSNADESHLRNWMRHVALPVLRERNPQISRALANAGRTLAAENSLLNEMARDAYRAVVRGGWIRAGAFGRLPTALQRRVARAYLEPHMPGGRTAAFHETERARLFVAVEKNGVCMLTRETALVRFRGGASAFNVDDPPYDSETPLKPPCELDCLRAELLDARDFRQRKLPKQQAAFDWEMLKKPLCVRNARPDDLIAPYGADRPKRAFEMMAKAGMPALLRPRYPAVCEGGGAPIWMPGVCADQRYAVTDGSRRVLFLTAKAPGE